MTRGRSTSSLLRQQWPRCGGGDEHDLGANLFMMAASRHGGDQIKDLAACWGVGRLSSTASTWGSPSACRPGHRGEDEDDDSFFLKKTKTVSGAGLWWPVVGLRPTG
jgi:hypothetical protein